MPEIAWIDPNSGQLLAIEFDCVSEENHEANAEITQHMVEDGAQVSDYVLLPPRKVSFEAIIVPSPLNFSTAEIVIPGLTGAVGKAKAVGAVTGTTTTKQFYGKHKEFPAAGVSVGGAGATAQRVLDAVGLPSTLPFLELPRAKTTITPKPPIDRADNWSAKVRQFSKPVGERLIACYQALLAVRNARVLVTYNSFLETYPSMAIVQLATKKTSEEALRFSIALEEFRTAATREVEIQVRKEVRDLRAQDSENTGAATGEEINPTDEVAKDPGQTLANSMSESLAKSMADKATGAGP